MKITGILGLLLLSGAVTAQISKPKGFTLTGQLTNAANKMVYFAHGGNTPEKVLYSDSTTTDAMGKFTFKGSLAEPARFTLKLKDNKGYKSIYMENANVVVAGNADSLHRLKVTGSREEMASQEVNNQRAPFEKFTAEIQKPYKAAAERKDSVAMKLEMEKLMKSYYGRLYDDTKAIVDKYPNTAMAAEMINNLTIYQMEDKADGLLKVVEKTPAGQFEKTKSVRKRIDILLSLAIGTKAPDFVQPDTTGKTIALSSMQGKYVLVDFWASWCMPCRAENPHLIKAYAKYKDKGFEILSVSIDTQRKGWLSAIKQDQLIWPQVSDLKQKNEAAALYAVIAIPTNYLLDRQGNIVAKNLRGEQLEEQLAKLL